MSYLLRFFICYDSFFPIPHTVVYFALIVLATLIFAFITRHDKVSSDVRRYRTVFFASLSGLALSLIIGLVPVLVYMSYFVINLFTFFIYGFPEDNGVWNNLLTFSLVSGFITGITAITAYRGMQDAEEDGL